MMSRKSDNENYIVMYEMNDAWMYSVKRVAEPIAPLILKDRDPRDERSFKICILSTRSSGSE